jgi:hypothetical protein
MLIIILLSILINAIVGACVYVAIDDDERRLYHWYSECPDPTGLTNFLILELWPIGLWVWLRNRGQEARDGR